ncbi:MAG: Uma2 family endonuclease, partial [Gemmataceae bacterium]
ASIQAHGRDSTHGVIYLAPPETPDANQLFGWLLTCVKLYADRTKQGAVFASRVAFRLANDQGPEPDIAFIRTEHLDRVKRSHVEGPPDFVMEIVAPDSVERDYYLKRARYEEYGVPEYWIIDDWERKITLFQRKEGKYRPARLRKGKLHSSILHGFSLQPESLWQESLPDELEMVLEILAKQPPP